MTTLLHSGWLFRTILIVSNLLTLRGLSGRFAFFALLFFVAAVIGYPIGHHLLHGELIESDFCPVHLLQTGLILLGPEPFLILAGLNVPLFTPGILLAIPLQLFYPRFAYPERPPPHS